ncbi:MAG TPA: 30S ribosomal protein S16 [Candidatus Omnitrophota bacterium]|nr:30S ribosomal protein S16 [Candidatus Omnitrophota bacterium]
MQVMIRLQRVGKSPNKRFNYRIVAISKSAPRDGRRLEILGHYDPTKQPEILLIKQDKLDKWLKNGAQMSDTVRSLVHRSKKAK